MFGYGNRAQRDEFSGQLARRKRVIKDELQAERVGEVDESNDRHV